VLHARKKIINEEDEVKSNISITSINVETLQKISKKKLTLIKKVGYVLILGTLVGLMSFGYYQGLKEKEDNKPNIDPTPITEIVHGMDYDFSNNIGTKEVDGIVYDLDKIKQDLGMLYYYAEPLTNEEIDKQFLGIAEYIKTIDKKNMTISNPNNIFDIHGYSSEKHDQIPEEIMIQIDKETNAKFEAATLNHPEYNGVVEIYYNMDYSGHGFDYIHGKVYFKDLTLKDKEQFVRDWKYQLNLLRRTFERARLDPEPDVPFPLSEVNVDIDNCVVYIKKL
jgi:hypothetical protein